MINNFSFKCFTILKCSCTSLQHLNRSFIPVVVLQLHFLFYFPSQAEEVWDLIPISGSVAKGSWTWSRNTVVGLLNGLLCIQCQTGRGIANWVWEEVNKLLRFEVITRAIPLSAGSL